METDFTSEKVDEMIKTLNMYETCYCTSMYKVSYEVMEDIISILEQFSKSLKEQTKVEVIEDDEEDTSNWIMP